MLYGMDEYKLGPLMFCGMNEGKKTWYRLEGFFGNKPQNPTAEIFQVDCMTLGRILLIAKEFKPRFLCAICK